LYTGWPIVKEGTVTPTLYGAA